MVGLLSWKEIKKSPLAPFIFIAGVCILFFCLGIIFDSRTIKWDDADQYFPLLWFTSHLWKAGNLPLWNPFLFSGYPAFADPGNQTFYPVNLFITIFTVFSAKVTYIQLAIHYMMSGFFMYILSGLYMRKKTSRLIASLIYMFSGYMICHFEHLTMINSVTWFPLILFFLEKGFGARNIFYFIPGSIGVALLILAGHPQSALYALFVLFIFAIYRCFDRSEGNCFSLFPLALFGLSIALGILISAVQLIPTYELSGHSTRSGALPYDFAAGSGQLDLAHLVTVVLPDYFGTIRGPYVGTLNISHSSMYLGIMFLIALPFAFVKRDKDVSFFAFLAVLSLLISMGDHGFIFKLLYYVIPGFDMFRSPAHFRFIVAFFGGILAGKGTEALLERKFPHRNSLSLYWLLISLATLYLVISIGSSVEVWKTRLIGIAVLGAFLTLFAWTFGAWKDGRISRDAFQVILLVIALADVFVNGFDAEVLKGTGRVALEEETRTIKLIRQEGHLLEPVSRTPFLSEYDLQRGLTRVYLDDQKSSHKEVLNHIYMGAYDYFKLWPVGFDRAILHKIFLVQGYNPLILKRYLIFNAVLRDMNYSNFLKLSNVKYVVAPDGSVSVLRDKYFLPRAFMVEKVITKNQPDRVLDTLSDVSFDVEHAAVVENSQVGGERELCRGKAQIDEYLPTRISISTESPCPSFLVLSDTYYPGWRVSVDSGEKIEPLRTNYYFRGAFVPAGFHRVVFEFMPKSFKVGLFVSSASIAVISVVAVIWLRKRKKRDKVKGS